MLATFTATLPGTFARSRTTMPATFATFPETFPATLAERHARRSNHRRPPATETTPPDQGAAIDKATGAQGRRQAGSASSKPRSRGQRHAIGSQTRRTAHAEQRQYWVAHRIKTPCRCVKMANKACGRKAPGIHREQRETPHSLRHAGRWSFLEFGQIEKQKNRLQQDIQQDQGRHLLKAP